MSKFNRSLITKSKFIDKRWTHWPNIYHLTLNWMKYLLFDNVISNFGESSKFSTCNCQTTIVVTIILKPLINIILSLASPRRLLNHYLGCHTSTIYKLAITKNLNLSTWDYLNSSKAQKSREARRQNRICLCLIWRVLYLLL